MGIYLNPGNEQFAASVNSELYVDKTELIKYTNSRIGKDRPLICSSRPRRFGKQQLSQCLQRITVRDAALKSYLRDSRSVKTKLLKCISINIM